jgi:type I restriction enzyme S subunit
MRSIDELLKQVRCPVDLEPDTIYREIGIRSHCKGIFHKPETTGKQIGDKRVFWVEPGCVVFNIVFAWEQAVAMTSDAEVGMIASHRFPMYCSRNGKFLPEYAWRYFSTPRGKYDLSIASPGGAGRNKTLGKEEFKQLKIPVPPIEYQRKVVDVLSTMDRTIAGVENLIAAKRTLKKGLAKQLLTGQRRLPGFNGKWERHTLAQLASVVMGSSPPSSAYNSDREGLPLIQGNADTRLRRTVPRIWTSAVTKSCRVGDILMSVRAPVGEISVTQHHACIGRGMCAIRAKRQTSHEYLYQALLLLKAQWLRLSQGSTFAAINSNDVRGLHIDCPPVLDEQRQIAIVLGAVDQEVTLLEKKLVSLDELKKGLMQKLLNGHHNIGGIQ